LFILFQALADSTLSYCATHALLTAVVCELTAVKLHLPAATRQLLVRSALVMNIGMARAQDILARQHGVPDEFQKNLIQKHPQLSADLLQSLGVIDPDQLDLVRWHHSRDESCGLAHNLPARRLLTLTDSLIAKMAARKTRHAISPLGAAKSFFLSSQADTSTLGSAMATVIGFYPPGTYLQLANGEKAVTIARGLRANQPHVATIVNADGMPLSKYLYRDTAEPQFPIHTPITADKIKIKVSLEQVLKMRAKLTTAAPA
jgi:hypothetical protein